MNTDVYHVFTRSIAGFTIFNSPDEYHRMQQLLGYYQQGRTVERYSYFARPQVMEKKQDHEDVAQMTVPEKLVDLICYGIMPTHLHCQIFERIPFGMSKYMQLVLNSYTRYFNIRHKRKGPLWESRFKRVQVTSEEQLLHVTRYIHLNPVTAGIVAKPEDWDYSSYHEYVNDGARNSGICTFRPFLTIDPVEYAEFVTSEIQAQKDRALSKATAISPRR